MALEEELEALKSLGNAIEYFADAKTLINITKQTQTELVQLFTIPTEENAQEMFHQHYW